MLCVAIEYISYFTVCFLHHTILYTRYTVLFENQNFDFSACANKPGGGSVDMMTLLHYRKELMPKEETQDIHSDFCKLTLTLMITSLLRVGLQL